MSASQKIGVIAASAYSWRAPSPPRILVPPTVCDQDITLPAYKGIGGQDITREDLKIITQGQHVAVDNTQHWQYEWRRKSQSILPFLYLGPSSAARNIDALKEQGITMLLVIRDTMTAQARLLSGDKVAKQLGIDASAVDVAGNQELIAAFPRAIKIINDHLISIYRQQAVSGTNTTDGIITINQQTFQQGKVFVFCESGNERSACVVAAYLMVMYGLDLVAAIQYVQSQRFCVAFDDGLKNLLFSYQDILEAQRNVSEFRKQEQEQSELHAGSKAGGKRGRVEMIAEDMDMDEGHLDKMDDEGRFEGRDGFVPFFDSFTR